MLKNDQYKNSEEYQLKLLNLPATVMLFIADIKLTANNTVKILELGNGAYSSFKGHDALYPEKPSFFY